MGNNDPKFGVLANNCTYWNTWGMLDCEPMSSIKTEIGVPFINTQVLYKSKQDIIDLSFIRLAWVTAISRSKDPNTVVGSIVVTQDGRNVSLGFNGLPPGLPEDKQIWSKECKYKYVQHAESNALLNSPFDTKGCTLYCTHRCCDLCMGKLLAAGIERIVYNEEYVNNVDPIVWDTLSKLFKEIKKVEDDSFLINLKQNKEQYRLNKI